MKNELLHFFVPEKGRRTKRQPISWLCCWAILLGIVCNACSDDDPVKKNPYLQVSTRAMLKEVVLIGLGLEHSDLLFDGRQALATVLRRAQ